MYRSTEWFVRPNHQHASEGIRPSTPTTAPPPSSSRHRRLRDAHAAASPSSTRPEFLEIAVTMPQAKLLYLLGASGDLHMSDLVAAARRLAVHGQRPRRPDRRPGPRDPPRRPGRPPPGGGRASPSRARPSSTASATSTPSRCATLLGASSTTTSSPASAAALAALARCRRSRGRGRGRPLHAKGSRMSRLSELAVAKRSVTLLLAAALFIAGISAWGNLQQELLPDIEFPVITVDRAAARRRRGRRRRSGDEADRARRSRACPGSRPLQSTSRQLDRARRRPVLVRHGRQGDARGHRAEHRRPRTCRRPSTRRSPRSTSTPSPVIIASIAATEPDGLTRPRGSPRPRSMPALLGIEGVAASTSRGGAEQQVAITLDPAKLAKANMSQPQVVGVLTANNITIPSGQVQADGTKTPVSTIGVIGSVDADPRHGRRRRGPGPARAPAQPAPRRAGRLGAAGRLRAAVDQPGRAACPQADHDRRPRHGRDRRRRRRPATRARDPETAPPVAVAVGHQDLDRQHGPGRGRRQRQARGARRASTPTSSP